MICYDLLKLEMLAFLTAAGENDHCLTWRADWLPG